MRLSETVKPISYLKAHASQIIKDASENQKTYIITHNGEAKVILQDVVSYENILESLDLLKILALSSENIVKGKVKSLDKAFTDLRSRIKKASK